MLGGGGKVEGPGSGEDSAEHRGKERVSPGVDGRVRLDRSRAGSAVLGEVEGLGTVDREEVSEETADVGAGHRGTRDGVGGLVTTVPGGEDVESGRKDVDALAVVGEVGAVVPKGGGTDGHGLSGAGRRVVAGVLVVAKGQQKPNSVELYSLSSSDGKVETRLDGSVDGVVKRLRLATTEGHVGDGSLVLGLAGLDELLLGVGVGLGSLLSSPARASANRPITTHENTHTTPATTSLMLPDPFEPRTLTATTSAALATPYLREAIVPAQWVP